MYQERILTSRALPSRVLRALALAGSLCLLLSACGSNSAALKPTAVPRPVTTPVPETLVGYASLAAPTLKVSVAEGKQLLSQMKSAKKTQALLDLANECTLVGGDLSNYQTSFTSTYVPPTAKSVYNAAAGGYKLVLAATDECGMAADSASHQSMQSAARDLYTGLRILDQSAKKVTPWFEAQS
jgi:hypothetical protein